MSELYATTIIARLGLIILLSILIQFLMKKRAHKDFYLVVIICHVRCT